MYKCTMPHILNTRLDLASDTFRENRDAMEQALDELNEQPDFDSPPVI